MAHREIKEKKELQARLQLAVSNTNSLVSSWLKPLVDTSNSVSNDKSKDDFLNLPIISNNSGLLLSNSVDDDGINTIGDYMKTGKSLSTLSIKKKGLDKPNKVNVVSSSKALNALQNKLRKGKRDEIRSGRNFSNNRNNNRNNNNRSNNNNNVNRNNNNNDSDSDEEIIERSKPKKSFGLLIDSKIKKR